MYEITYDKPDVIKIGPFTSSKKELVDLLKAWIVVSIAFGIYMVGGYRFILSTKTIFSILMGAATVGIAFLLHELAHKIVAQHYNCWAEFRSFDTLLWFTLAVSLLPIFIAAPGAVMIVGTVTRDRNGKISLAGPLTNIVLALLFLGAAFFATQGIISQLVSYGFMINVWLGAFNLIPILNFDGKKILEWSKPVYIGMVVISVALIVLMSIA